MTITAVEVGREGSQIGGGLPRHFFFVVSAFILEIGDSPLVLVVLLLVIGLSGISLVRAQGRDELSSFILGVVQHFPSILPLRLRLLPLKIIQLLPRRRSMGLQRCCLTGTSQSSSPRPLCLQWILPPDHPYLVLLCSFRWTIFEFVFLDLELYSAVTICADFLYLTTLDLFVNSVRLARILRAVLEVSTFHRPALIVQAAFVENFEWVGSRCSLSAVVEAV